MGYVGFLFNIDLDERREKYIRILNYKSKIHTHSLTSERINEIVVKKNIVIFLNLENVNGNFIIGVSSFKEEDCDFFYLNKDFNLEKFLVFEKSNFKVGKILANDKNVIDFDFLTFWFKGESYRLIRETLLIDEDINNLNEEINVRIKFLMNYFVV